jgi:hypothetical protein
MVETKTTKVTLKNRTAQGIPLEAVFLPEKGMNMISYKRGEIEVIDQATFSLFEERFAGLGALIGPHFHRRKTELIPTIPDESLFPHIARVKAGGVQEPFSHGIGRYAPWKAEYSETHIDAQLSGDDLWEGVKLSTLEGQNFKMQFRCDLTPNGLKIDYSVVSDTDSVVGLHYYYALPKKTGNVQTRVQNKMLENGSKVPLPWPMNDQNEVIIPLGESDIDCTLFSFPHSREGRMVLDAGDYRVEKRMQCRSAENSWQFYHPKNATFVCIEPISAQDPRHPNLTVSSIQVEIEILDI